MKYSKTLLSVLCFAGILSVTGHEGHDHGSHEGESEIVSDKLHILTGQNFD
jgi:hypothetical protein